ESWRASGETRQNLSLKLARLSETRRALSPSEIHSRLARSITFAWQAPFSPSEQAQTWVLSYEFNPKLTQISFFLIY
ncbi:hypothetical protein A2U01_0094420, partial [Trifolium medium]|nr:hypothetical protein [Trifolium medium]